MPCEALYTPYFSREREIRYSLLNTLHRVFCHSSIHALWNDDDYSQIHELRNDGWFTAFPSKAAKCLFSTLPSTNCKQQFFLLHLWTVIWYFLTLCPAESDLLLFFPQSAKRDLLLFLLLCTGNGEIVTLHYGPRKKVTIYSSFHALHMVTCYHSFLAMKRMISYSFFHL